MYVYMIPARQISQIGKESMEWKWQEIQLRTVLAPALFDKLPECIDNRARPSQVFGPGRAARESVLII